MELMEITKEEYDELLDQVKALKLMVQNLEDVVEDSIIGLNIRDNAIEGRHINSGEITIAKLDVNLDEFNGTLDDVSDGVNYGRIYKTSLSNGLALLSEAAGDLDDISNGTYGKVLVTNITAGKIVLAECTGSIDNIENGVDYGKVLLTDISAGHILLSTCSGNLDDIDAGTTYDRVLKSSLQGGVALLSQAIGDLDDISNGTYGKVLTTDISSGHILLTTCEGGLSDITGDLDDIANGTLYGKIDITDISSGHITLTSCVGDLDDIANGSTYGKIALTSISAGKVIIAGLDSGITDRMFANLTTKNTVEAWRHASDVTLIDGGDIYANSLTIAKLATDATNKMFGADATKTNVEGWVHASDVTKIDGGDIYTDSITVRKITLDSAGYLKTTGKDSYADTTSGIWMGYDSGYKLNIGSATQYLKWSGSALYVHGKLYVGGGTNEDIYFEDSGIRLYDAGSQYLRFYKSGYAWMDIILSATASTLRTSGDLFQIMCPNLGIAVYETGVLRLSNLASNPAGLTGGICMVNNALKYWNGSAWVIAT